jgi:hypothetical protein
MRSLIIEKVKKHNMTLMYNLFYNLLISGTNPEGRANILDGDRRATAEMIALFVPNCSKQAVSEQALVAVETLNKIIDKVMNDLMPKNFLNISHNVTKKNTEGNLFTA